MLRDILYLLDERDRAAAAGLTVMIIVGSALEVLGIGLLVPYLRLVSEPTAAHEHAVVGDLLDRLGVGSPSGVVVLASILLAVLFVFKNGYLALQVRLLERFLYQRLVRWGRRLLEGYLDAPYERFIERNSSDLVRNLNTETGQVVGLLHGQMILISEGLVVLGLLGVVLNEYPTAGIVGLLSVGGVAMVTVRSIRPHLEKLGKARAEAGGRMIRWIQQSLGSVWTIRVHDSSDYFLTRYTVATKDMARALERGAVLAQYPRFILETVAVLGLIAAVFVFQVTAGTTADVMPMLLLLGIVLVRLLPSTNRIVTAMNRLRFGIPALRIVAGDLRESERWRHESADRSSTSEIQDGRGNLEISLRRELKADGVSVVFRNEVTALRDVSLCVRSGAFAGVVGESGAGKSTFVNVILGLVRPTGGRVTADGRDIWENVREWHRRVGYIPQDIYLLDDTIRRNVAFGVPDEEIFDEIVWQALRAAQVDGFVRSLPLALDARVGERGVRISGGQRQRIGIARALYRKPDLLVLDEATSALDPQTERSLLDVVEALAGEKTVVMVTHRLAATRRCDVVHVLERGMLVATGNYSELRANHALFSEAAAIGEGETA